MTTKTTPAPRITYDTDSTNYRLFNTDNGVVGRSDGLMQFTLDGNFQFVAEFDATYQAVVDTEDNSKVGITNITVDRKIEYSEFATLLDNGDKGMDLPPLQLSEDVVAAVRTLITTEIENSFNHSNRDFDEDFEWDIEPADKVVCYDVFFEVFCPDIKVFTDVRVDIVNASNDFEAIVDALDNEGLTDLDSIEDALTDGRSERGQTDFHGVTVWNKDKSMGYCVDRVVPLKAVDIQVEYDGKMQNKRIFVPIDSQENIFGRYYD